MARKILVVDDEKLIVKGIRFSLEQDGMEVDCAYDGQEAFELASKDQLDAFVKDPDAHLYSAYLNKDTGEYEFVKRKDHPTIQLELD